MRYPAFMETYCYECSGQQPIVKILGIREMPHTDALSVAVRLLCGHERQGKDGRVAMSRENRDRIVNVITEMKLLQWQEKVGVAGALSMTG